MAHSEKDCTFVLFYATYQRKTTIQKNNRTTKNMQENHFKRTTVTAALPYANGGVHIGHLAGVYVPADIYVRYLRLKR